MSGKFSIVLIFVLMLTGNIHLQQEYENENERNDQETDEDLDETTTEKTKFPRIKGVFDHDQINKDENLLFLKTYNQTKATISVFYSFKSKSGRKNLFFKT